MTQTGTVNASLLNLRSSPDGDVLTQLERGTQVEVLGTNGDWLNVNAAGQTGFVKASFIKLNTAGTTPSGQPAPPSPASGSFRFVGNAAVAPDGTQFGKKFKLGAFNFGTTSIADFVSSNAAMFSGLSPSRLRVMSAVSANEGKLESFNTWDNSFMTFGALQWTLGAGTAAGELAALLNRLKTANPDVFNECFGQFGLDISVGTFQPGITPTGFVLLNGAKLLSVTQKQQLRTLEWAFRFWKAGANNVVRQIQIQHASDRIDLFYRSPRHMIGSRFIADYVTSEFGVALILDQHVNRPGNVPATIASAVTKFVAQLGSDNPASWGDAEETDLLNIYIQLRANTTMTDSTDRANRIRQAVAAGKASNKRGSFQP